MQFSRTQPAVLLAATQGRGLQFQQRELAKISADVVHPFCERAFEDCLKVLDVMEATFKKSKFTILYREQCQKFLSEPPPPGWSGEIELTEK